MQSAGLKDRISHHLGPARTQYQQAAEKALGKVLEKKPDLSADAVDAWLQQMWPESGRHGGSVDPIGAQRVLEAFSDRKPPAPSNQLGGPTMRLGAGATLGALAKDDGISWTASIDKSKVDASVVAYGSDVRWFSTLNLESPETHRAFAEFCGWTAPPSQWKGTSWESDATVQFWAAGRLAARHHLPSDAMRAEIEKIADADPKERPAMWYALENDMSGRVAAAAERFAVYTAFVQNGPKIADKIRMGVLDEGAARNELEDQFKVPRGSISDEVWSNLMSGFRSGHYDDAVERLMGLGYCQVLYRDQVLQVTT